MKNVFLRKKAVREISSHVKADGKNILPVENVYLARCNSPQSLKISYIFVGASTRFWFFIAQEKTLEFASLQKRGFNVPTSYTDINGVCPVVINQGIDKLLGKKTE